MFESTRLAADKPLQAARVFENIASAIEEAERAAKKADADSKHATTMVSTDVH